MTNDEFIRRELGVYQALYRFRSTRLYWSPVLESDEQLNENAKDRNRNKSRKGNLSKMSDKSSANYSNSLSSALYHYSFGCSIDSFATNNFQFQPPFLPVEAKIFNHFDETFHKCKHKQGENDKKKGISLISQEDNDDKRIEKLARELVNLNWLNWFQKTMVK